MKSKKIFAVSVFGLILVTSMLAINNIAAAPSTPGKEVPVDSDQYKGNVDAGANNTYRFKNRFQFQLRTNASADVDIEADVDGIGDRSFSLSGNTSSGQKLSLRFEDEDAEVGLEKGNRVQARNQNRYRYQEKFMMNASLNGTGQVQARLELTTENSDSTWAYYDEEAEEWIEVVSEYSNGVLSAETDHFSVWTVLETESDEGAAIDGYPLLFGLVGVGVLGIALLTKKRRH